MFWRKKKKRDEFPEDEIFEEMEREMERIAKVMRKMLHELVREDATGKPIVHGVKITIGPDGIPHVEEFGNVRKKELSDYREPLVDVIERDGEIIITAELPGVEKKDIKINVKERVLTINAESDPFKYYKTVLLPQGTDPSTARATFKNGILEIQMKKIEGGDSKDGVEIKVE